LSNSSIKSIPEESVEYKTLLEVQNRLFKEYEENNEIFDASDVKKIIKSLRYLRRFAQRQDGNVNKTFEMVKNTLIWRKAMKIPLMTDDLIPLEFYDLGIAFINGTDRDGNFIFNVRAKYAYFNENVNTALERMCIFMLFKVIEASITAGTGWTLLLDITGISVTQWDFSELVWLLKVVINYMPAGLKSAILYNMPWFAKPFAKILMPFIPREWKHIIHIVGPKELPKLVPEEFIPCYMENPKNKFVIPTPSDAKSMSEIDTTILDTDKHLLLKFCQQVLARVK
ncbi:Motile sperm domain-containing protein 2-like protein, partial [Leptotrombidium deliense]